MATVPLSAIGSCLTVLCLALLASACGHEIGDSCSSSLDCSQSSSRICDRTQSGGYCTINPCERGTCPEESTCVEFRPSEVRLAVTYCMKKCSSDGDCRDDEGYHCKTATEFNACEAKTLDGEEQRFCANAPAVPPAGAPTGPMCISQPAAEP